MKAKKIYAKYHLQSADGKYNIYAEIGDDSITLETYKGEKDFTFFKSKKEDVKAIAELFSKACEL